MIRAATLALLVSTMPLHAAYLAGNGQTVRSLPQSGQLEVLGRSGDGGAGAYYCAAAEAAVARLGARSTDRLRFEGMPRGDRGAVFTLQRDAPRDPGFRILGRRGTTLSIAASKSHCRY